jgi:FKBP-type peptidyl-prolyl cis-trans isomerase FkpA
MKYLLPLFVLSLLLNSCGATYSEEDKLQFNQTIKKYLQKKGVPCEQSDSGLFYHIEREGEGEYLRFQDVVSFKYKGYFLDGNIFDESKAPVQFKVSQLIGGWKETMLMLKPGGKAFIVVPPQLGYGDKSLADIPPNSVLVFELEVLEVK